MHISSRSTTTSTDRAFEYPNPSFRGPIVFSRQVKHPPERAQTYCTILKQVTAFSDGLLRILCSFAGYSEIVDLAVGLAESAPLRPLEWVSVPWTSQHPRGCVSLSLSAVSRGVGESCDAPLSLGCTGLEPSAAVRCLGIPQSPIRTLTAVPRERLGLRAPRRNDSAVYGIIDPEMRDMQCLLPTSNAVIALHRALVAAVSLTTSRDSRPWLLPRARTSADYLKLLEKSRKD